MGLEVIDYLATTGKSPIHTANTSYKVLFTIIVITLLIITKSLYFPYLILLLLFTIMVINRVPLLKIIPFLFYPVFFSGLLVLGLGHNLETAFWVIAKTVAIATSMLLLVATTPIYYLFSLFSKFLPSFITDSLFFTYRSFFIFHKLISNLLLTIKLKGGTGRFSVFRNLKNAGGAIAITFIKALDSAERMKEIFYIRGYEIGNIKLEKEKTTIWNLYPVFLSIFSILLYFWV